MGETFADWIGKESSASGLGYGTGIVSVILTTFIVIFVGYLSVTHKDVQEKTKAATEKSNKLKVE